MNRIHLYFKTPPQKDRYFFGDNHLFNLLRKILKRKKTSGIKKVFDNLCKGFDELNIDYDINLPFKKIYTDEPVVVLGLGKFALQGYAQPNPIIAGIGLMTHPNEWPDLFEKYPVAKYLQHSIWTNNIYARYFGKNNCNLWPAGIDTNHWLANKKTKKQIDFLIYNKIMWDKQATAINLRLPLLNKLDQLGLSYKEIVYGQYKETEYKSLLQQCKAMIFLCEHESQGFACCEALSMDVPVFAWDQGFWLDPNRFLWDSPVVPASSVPFFDETCGTRFTDLNDFENKIEPFWKNVQAEKYKPRNYILNNLTLKKSAERMLEIISTVYK